MTGMNWDDLTPDERLLAEQAILNFRELNKAGHAAADGTVLNTCETLAMQQGRELIRRTIEVTLHEQAQAVEKKGADPDVLLRNEASSSGSQGAQAHDRRRPCEAQPRVLRVPGVPGQRLSAG